jgi:hypothetical protein
MQGKFYGYGYFLISAEGLNFDFNDDFSMIDTLSGRCYILAPNQAS